MIGNKYRVYVDDTVGWWNFWQTCPLVSGVRIMGQT